jgi:hypothetical protein
MIFISHRGNLNGPDETIENTTIAIDRAIDKGFDVEIDVRKHGNLLFLGHDIAEKNIDLYWIMKRLDKLWIHCKNESALSYFHRLSKTVTNINYFWHEEDTATLTSKGYIWAYPGCQPILNSIGVLPEIYNDDVSSCIGICTDYPEKYSKLR